MADDDVFLNAIRHAQSIYRDRPGSLPVFATAEPRAEAKDLAARMKAQEQPEGPGQSFMDEIRELLDRTQVTPGLSLRDLIRQKGGSLSKQEILDSIRSLRSHAKAKAQNRAPGPPMRALRKAERVDAAPDIRLRDQVDDDQRAWQAQHQGLSRVGNIASGGATDPNATMNAVDVLLAAMPFLSKLEHTATAGMRMVHAPGRDLVSRFLHGMPQESADWAARGMYASDAQEHMDALSEPGAEDAGMGRYLNFLKAMKRGGLVLNDMYTSPEFPSMTGDRPPVDVTMPPRE